ncbi:SDR family NAD(P)-dependent oxidoreductase [Cryptosporangium sp. NPDC048952]|uniref:SDR family NAD(P)-dependent oxidoreductase n=1 Tax=Cryptosporangium sp. NPDC048952 TaxID=3363961 RepID=UPI0037145AF7
MDLQLNGRTAYVTGTATGIGREIVRLLAAEGASVFAVDRAIDDLTDYVTADGLETVRPYAADLAVLDECNAAADEAVRHFGGAPDILINNVGIGRMLPFEELTDEDFHRTFEVNFFAMARTCRRLVPLMAQRGSGAVVNVTSDLAGQPETVFVDYAASKAAVVSLSKTLARTYAPAVRVNDVSPGPIWTPLWFREGGYLETVEANYGLKGDAAIKELIRDREIPLGRLGEPVEVARAVVFLASPLAAYTTGSSLGVNGGTVRAAF